MDGYATKTGQDSHGIHGLRTPFGMGHKEACPVRGRIVQPPSLFAHVDACLITMEVLCAVHVPDSPALKVFEQSMGTYKKIVDAALRQEKTVLSKVALDAVVWLHLSHIQIDYMCFCGVANWTFRSLQKSVAGQEHAKTILSEARLAYYVRFLLTGT